MNQKQKCKKGKIIPNGVSLEKHENNTIVFFTNLGYTVELIPPVLTPNSKTPDLMMLGQPWEMKSPLSNSKNAIERSFKKAAQQSENIILDLRRTTAKSTEAIKIYEKLFNGSKRVRKMKIITKNQELKEYNKKWA